jgi:hypothetical protein
MARARRKAALEPWIGTKISATIIDFGQPLLNQLPADAPRELREQVVQLIVTLWNAHVMAHSWGQPEHLTAIREMLAQAAGDQTLDVQALMAFEVLSARRQELRFVNDPRAVGLWEVRDTAPGQWSIRCDARLPPGPAPAAVKAR